MSDIFVGIDGTTEHKTRAVHIGSPLDADMTFVGALFRGSTAGRDHKHWFAGPDVGGFRVPECVGMPLEFIMKARSGQSQSRIAIAGYSRGAYAALRVAQGLLKAGVSVDALILIDTVKVTLADTEAAVGQVLDRYDQGFDTGKEAQKMGTKFGRAGVAYPSPIGVRNAAAVYGARMEAEVYKPDPTARAQGSWNLVDPVGRFVVPANVKTVINVQRNPAVRSRDWTMGVAPVSVQTGSSSMTSRTFMLSHSGMGGMPFRGDLPGAAVTRLREWTECRALAEFLRGQAAQTGLFQYLKHPTLEFPTPPERWLSHVSIRLQYQDYRRQFGSDGLTPDQDIKDDKEAKLDRYASAARGRY